MLAQAHVRTYLYQGRAPGPLACMATFSARSAPAPALGANNRRTFPVLPQAGRPGGGEPVPGPMTMVAAAPGTMELQLQQQQQQQQRPPDAAPPPVALPGAAGRPHTPAPAAPAVQSEAIDQRPVQECLSKLWVTATSMSALLNAFTVGAAAQLEQQLPQVGAVVVPAELAVCS